MKKIKRGRWKTSIYTVELFYEVFSLPIKENVNSPGF